MIIHPESGQNHFLNEAKIIKVIIYDNRKVGFFYKIFVDKSVNE